jgi:hypothetical protein
VPYRRPFRILVRPLCAVIVLATSALAPAAVGAQAASPAFVTAVPSPTFGQVSDDSRSSPFAGLFGPGVAMRASSSTAREFSGAPRLLDSIVLASGEPLRECDGCPPRRPARAVLQTLAVNVAFNLVNRLREPNDEFKVSLSSWWENLRYGLEWDYNSFSINQFGHPYQGGLYFNAGRANGLSFWESMPLAALGSATWEYFGERNHASVNDFVTTTMGGIALGEMFHRAGWLIRDTTVGGGSRKWHEILAMAVDPITGANRFLNGDASRVSENPRDLKPTSTGGDFEAGVQWNGEPNERAVSSAGKPFVGLRLGYNDPFATPYRVPFDAFTVTLRMGGGSGISEANVRGRLYGRFVRGAGTERPTEFLVVQGYDYESNGIFDYGGQSILAGLSRRFGTAASVRLDAFGIGGPIILGAITSPLLESAPSAEAEAEHELRTYDFGPGAGVAGGAVLRVRSQPVARVAYGGFLIRSVSSIEGVSARHYAQFLRVDVLVPLWRQLRIGFSGDYVNRSVHYDNLPDVHQWIPEFRVFLAKVSR